MGKLLCEKNLRDVWCRNESVRAEIGPILQTHTHTHAAKLVVEINLKREECSGRNRGNNSEHRWSQLATINVYMFRMDEDNLKRPLHFNH